MGRDASRTCCEIEVRENIQEAPKSDYDGVPVTLLSPGPTRLSWTLVVFFFDIITKPCNFQT